ncbi:putative LuxR family transcriptional regulator [Microlunatus phosphovorus NM-1]|uniref:Putative LuxR family transcriptional regulator n=1 Tax=Microlunatus phosphovorus (strain ATCC 700054 / DSM 10555 / JCM 9379 / NBRC 101784 / NCIMB 13414 / VKM Ac-1990 / NM-1) TaxID=1032480 RepID=F5XT60_MICPN|nr:helix-turn-helix transcriptional regulator [Microlunatus phosphovorus]BAK34932.1 putative LuxR family transcriptional regulator [Microlunatus phosphovorus NM-1]
MNAVLSAAEARRQRAELLHQISTASSVTEVFAVASRRLHELVPHDAAAWVTTDPATGFPSAPSLLDDFSGPMDVCTAHWHREWMEPDVNLFRRLARAERPAGALLATAVDPERSPRFRGFMQPLGFADDLRAVFRVGETPWAVTTLWRREGQPAFSATEAGLVADLSAPLGDAVRRLVREDLVRRDLEREGLGVNVTAGGERPGLFLFDARGRLVSVNEHAAAWLDELPRQELVPTQFGLQLPLWLLVTAVRARDSLAAGGDGLAQTRVRSRAGRWLVGHAAATRDAAGEPAGAAVTIEPASPALVAPIAVEAYGLTAREREITRQIARGAGTDEIATSLFLSPHTVRDHVKSILNKVGVSSRGEVVAALYTEQFEPAHFAGFDGTHTG